MGLKLKHIILAGFLLCLCLLESYGRPHKKRTSNECPPRRPICTNPCKPKNVCEPNNDPHKKKCNKWLNSQPEENPKSVILDDDNNSNTNDAKENNGKTDKNQNDNWVTLDNYSMKPGYSAEGDNVQRTPLEIKQWVVKIDTAEPQNNGKEGPLTSSRQSMSGFVAERLHEMEPSDMSSSTPEQGRVDKAVNRVVRLSKKLQGTLEQLLAKEEMNQGSIENGSALNTALREALSELSRINSNMPRDSGSV